MNLSTNLVAFITDTTWDTIPDNVKQHVEMTLFNHLAVGIGGSEDVTVTIAQEALVKLAGNRTSPILGKDVRSDIYTSSLLNGIAGHVDDYDDTHLTTVIHPAAPVVPVVLALAESLGISGEEFLTAVAVGCEVALKVGMSISPSHYDEGWHITGTCGVFGATAAAGRLLSLTHKEMTMALSLAATQAAGVREAFGTMAKSLHTGLAAQNGLLAALLVKNGLNAPESPFDGPFAFPHLYAKQFDPSYLTSGLEHWEILSNSFKPYPCGIVIHPAADAAIELHRQIEGDWRQVNRIVLKAHPLVLDLTGKFRPQRGLEGKFSIYYCIASSLIHGCLRVNQFTDSMVGASDAYELQGNITVEIDDAIPRDACRLQAVLSDGREIDVVIDHATGSADNPMTRELLMNKARHLIDPVLGPGMAGKIEGAVAVLSDQKTIANLIGAITKPVQEVTCQ